MNLILVSDYAAVELLAELFTFFFGTLGSPEEDGVELDLASLALLLEFEEDDPLESGAQ